MSGQIHLSLQELRAVQLAQLEMLREVHRICEKHGIKYCIIAGTFLGAVRHKKHIPWDDDADVAMLREEYEKFATICQTEIDSEKFYFQDHKKTKGYRWGYGKIRRKGTEFVRLKQEHMPYEQGIFIDVFPLDYVPEFSPLRALHCLFCFAIRKTLWFGAKNKLIAKIPLSFIFFFYNILTKAKPTSLVRILTFPTVKNRIYAYKAKWYKELSEIEFDGYNFPCPKDGDEYLTFKFGNYMELPPESERKTHPVSRLKVQLKPD
ncbi:MAG: LicD family protein [Fibromonadaceae bacterium]|nr:LicD family protein [Fibromonadaceae bacterium]